MLVSVSKPRKPILASTVNSLTHAFYRQLACSVFQHIVRVVLQQQHYLLWEWIRIWSVNSAIGVLLIHSGVFIVVCEQCLVQHRRWSLQNSRAVIYCSFSNRTLLG